MFGTLKVSKCNLPFVYDRYKRYYCGLCSLLAQEYGPLARTLVNYDITYFYLLLSAVSGAQPEPTQVACPVSPMRKRAAVLDEVTGRFAAAANVYLAGMKLRDDIYDEGSFAKRAAYRLLRSRERKAVSYLESIGIEAAKAESLFAMQQDNEQRGTTLADYSASTEAGLSFLFHEAARTTGLSMANVDALATVGSGLGRIIYVLDSFVDYPSDVKCSTFNALAEAFGDKMTLHGTLSEDVRNSLLHLLRTSLSDVRAGIALLELRSEADVVDAVMDNLERKIITLVENTESMAALEARAKTRSFSYLLTHPQLIVQGRAAHRRRRHSACCCDGDDLCTAWICCDAADCDCDTAEGCAQGDCCEFMECCG